MEEKKGSPGNDDNLEMENQFLKMKMMLEHGAHFDSSKDLPPSIENDFLRSVMEFEKQWEKNERIKIFDKLGRPGQFKPVKDIPDDEIEDRWVELYEYLQERGIDLSVCSPNVKARELYRFTLEELFNAETDDINIAGMTTCFIYDEFHPDYEYENGRRAVEDCLPYFFDKTLCYDHYFAERIRVNQHENLTKEELKYVMQKFKDQYDEIVPMHFSIRSCKIENDQCVVHGGYEGALFMNGKSTIKRGNWMVGMELEPELGYWNINDVQIRGLPIP